MIWRLAGLLLTLLGLYIGFELVRHALSRPKVEPVAATAPIVKPAPVIPAPAPARPPDLAASPAKPAPCAPAPAFTAAAAMNAASLTGAAWSVFGRPETGWEIYAPLVAHEIGAACGPDQPGFAAALADWQGRNGRPATGIMDPDTLKALDILWLRRRPFVAASAHGACPPPPPAAALASATPAEGYLTKSIQLRAGALEAYRRMAAAARAELPSMAADKRLLTIFSGYRDPADDAARCAKDGNCGTIAKANCSAHRTGLAMDLFLGAPPGFPPESSADANRLYQSRSEVYRWLVANAARFGFMPYPFEPWHWEWTGEAP